jgi:hypothetical protein
MAAIDSLPHLQPIAQPDDHSGPNRGPDDHHPGRPDHHDRPIPPPPPPPHQLMGPNPEIERWHQGQTESTLGLVATGVGIILGFVGIVRVFFAQAEKQYAAEQLARENL